MSQVAHGAQLGSRSCPAGHSWSLSHVLVPRVAGLSGKGVCPLCWSGPGHDLAGEIVCWPCHCLAFLTMVPTAEMTVVLEPLALVVTVTTEGSVALVVRRAGCAMVGTGIAESHLLFLFWASAGKGR